MFESMMFALLWSQLMRNWCIMRRNLCCLCILFLYVRTGMFWVCLECIECCFLQVGVSEIAGTRRVHRVGAANRWAEYQEVVIRSGHAAYLCSCREGVTVSRFAPRE